MNRRSILRSGLGFATAGALPVAARQRAGAQTAKLRVSMSPIEAGAPSGYAFEAGFYAKHGLDVVLVTGGANGSVIAEAVAAGAVDVGSGNTLAVATAHEHGVPFVFLSPSGDWQSTAPSSGLAVAQTSPIRVASDLTGKTVGVAIVHGLAEIAVRAWVDKNGGTSSAVKFLELPYSAMGAAITSGRVDAAHVEEPTLTNLGTVNFRVIAAPSDAIAPQWCQGGFFSTLEFAKSHPDIVKKFAAAMAETAVWANKNHDATAKILEKYSNSPLNPATRRMFFPEHLRAEEFQPLIDAAARYGVLKATFPAKDLFAPGL